MFRVSPQVILFEFILDKSGNLLYWLNESNQWVLNSTTPYKGITVYNASKAQLNHYFVYSFFNSANDAQSHTNQIITGLSGVITATPYPTDASPAELSGVTALDLTKNISFSLTGNTLYKTTYSIASPVGFNYVLVTYMRS